MLPSFLNIHYHGIDLVISTGSLFGVLGVAVGVGIYFLWKESRRRAGYQVLLLAVLVVGALFGARFFSAVLSILRFPGKSFLFYLGTSGSTIMGGIAGGGAAALLFRVFDRRNTANDRALDRALIAFSAGAAVLRIGCFFHGCCYGILAPEFPCTVTYPETWIIPKIFNMEIPAGPRLPFPLIAAGFLLCMTVILWVIYRGVPRLPGLPASLFFFLYGIGRFLLEFIRDEPERLVLGTFTVGQWFGLVCLPIGGILLIRALRRAAFTGPASFDSLKQP
ncbi:MAG TPA: hypothetical protein ENN69_06455 [Spirochaetia bacterium]|nr:hypothetical protein [Spirochaetia bacterium]